MMQRISGLKRSIATIVAGTTIRHCQCTGQEPSREGSWPGSTRAISGRARSCRNRQTRPGLTHCCQQPRLSCNTLRPQVRLGDALLEHGMLDGLPCHGQPTRSTKRSGRVPPGPALH
jgi:hypothetical protein